MAQTHLQVQNRVHFWSDAPVAKQDIETAARKQR